jgi:hypothetical protein
MVLSISSKVRASENRIVGVQDIHYLTAIEHTLVGLRLPEPDLVHKCFGQVLVPYPTCLLLAIDFAMELQHVVFCVSFVKWNPKASACIAAYIEDFQGPAKKVNRAIKDLEEKE